MIKLGTPIYEVERQQWNYGRLFEAAAAASRGTKVLYCRYRSTGGTVAWLGHPRLCSLLLVTKTEETLAAGTAANRSTI